VRIYSNTEEKDLLASVTIVICSFNRPKHLIETISFLAMAGLRFIAVDGSRRANEALSKQEFSQSVYIHAPTLNYEERMGLAAKHIKTPYTLSMCDDEYYFPNTVASAVEFLNGNLDYSSCTGEAVGFTVKSGEIKFHSVYPELRGFTLTSNVAITRMREHLSRYRVASYYSVVRTQIWSEVWSQICKRKYSPLAISELQFEAAISFSGKLKVLPEVMWWRNQTVPSHAPTPSTQDGTIVQFLAWWKNSKYASEKVDFLDTTSQLLLGLIKPPHQISKKVLYRATSKAFQGYFFYNWIPRQHARNLARSLLIRFLAVADSSGQDSDNYSLLSKVGKGTNVDFLWYEIISSRIKDFYLGQRSNLY
jgi:glycosyltransferase domain-containing protein